MAKDEWRWIGPDGFEYSGSKERLCDALTMGGLPITTPVWHAGFEAWMPVHAVPELAEELVESRPFSPAPLPEMKTPPPIGISADAVVVAAPGADMRVVAPAPGVPAPQPWPPAAPKKRGPSLLGILVPVVGGLLVLGLILGVGAVAGSKAKKTVTKPPAASTTSGKRADVAPTAVASRARCGATRSQSIAKTVYGKVPIVVSASPSLEMLGVGFAENKTLAHGLVVNAETLAVVSQQSVPSATPIVSATAAVSEKTLRLVVDADDPHLRLARTVEAEPSFKIGIAADGIAKLDAAGQVHSIWKSDPAADYTVPRVEGSDNLGHFVALRRGGLAGKIVGGWIGRDGAPGSGLATLELESQQVGTPNLGVGSSGVLIAAAARASEQAPWDVMVGTAAPGKVPQRLSSLAVPRESPAADRMAPAAAALPDGRWALQWTEKTSSGHAVRIALLDQKLAPVSDPVTVSPPAAEAGQGELWASADRVVSLYLVKNENGHELWASTLVCH